MRCWVLLLITALSTIVRGLPTTTTRTTTDKLLENTANSQPLQQSSSELFAVDVSRYAQLLSTHLLLDHLENAFYMLSRKISVQFRDSIHVNVNVSPQHDPSLSSPVDVHILKGQLKGAVGSFIEDKFPAVWGRHAAALNKASLQSYVELVVQKLCIPDEQQGQQRQQYDDSYNEREDTLVITTPTTVSNVCLEAHARQFLSSVDRYLGNHVKRTIADIVSYELPVLFDTTRAQVQDIVEHFNQQVLSEQDHLELVLEADHTEWWVPAEVNEVLETVVHWQTPNNELFLLQSNNNNNNNDINGNEQAGKRPAEDARTMFDAVHHFATLARVSPEQQF
ncbi:hypothetical protein BDB00DRAFT_802410 [Zychaea mexicana]|uniref:uncharacterized protein n=1 Tax=Zychaea mexicana TaxID=64656 RepID=UPI0022FDE45C|nr:uncharacterized protein BDB00DRAFT_802410 [Zychaea mexicana]KAI9497898.1 hypothetical protein BDB00DRAFT_802410 [Zychaea mexicana]